MTESLCFPINLSRYAIILDGEPCHADFLKEQLVTYQVIIVCDGAWNKLSTIFQKKISQLPIILLGDGDSITNPPKQYIYIDDQDTTDFEKALNYVKDSYLEADRVNIDIFQIGGGLMDHALSNLSLVAKWSDMFDFQLIADNYFYRYIHHENIEDILIDKAQNKTISIIPFPCLEIITTQGLKYHIKNEKFSLLTHQSLRNKVVAQQAKLSVLGSGFLMFSW